MSKKNVLTKKISSRAITALLAERNAKKSSFQDNSFVAQACERVFGSELLTDHWVESINQWAEGVDIAADSETKLHPKGSTITLVNVPIVKKTSRNRNRNDSNFLDYIAEDEDGWKYWFRIRANWQSRKVCRKRGKEFSFPKKGERITLTAKVSENKAGITFLSYIEDWEIVRK